MVDTASAAQRDPVDLIALARQYADMSKDSRGREEFVFDEHGLESFLLAALASRPAVQQEGWVLTDPTGKQWTGETKMACMRAETNDRIPAAVQLERILAAAEETRRDEERECRSAYDNTYHKVKADMGYDQWRMVWFKAVDAVLAPNLSPATPRPEDVSQKAGKDATYWHDRYCTEKKERKDWQERAEAPTVEQAITALVTALAESKGWMRDYADSIIRDAIDRRDGPDAEAIRREALEEAARLCEWRAHAIDGGGNAYLRSRDALDCALAIRALAAPGERNG